MNCFLDTSALVKLFQEEEGSYFVEGLVNDPNNQIWVLELAQIEFLSCIYRRYRENEITEEDLETVIRSFNDQISEFTVECLGPSIFREAAQLMGEYGKEHGLRALDSLQLAACRLLYDSNWLFICADLKLCDVAALCAISVVNPILKPPSNSLFSGS